MPIKHSMRASEWIRAAVDDGFARRRKPKQQDGGELTSSELSILLLAIVTPPIAQRLGDLINAPCI